VRWRAARAAACGRMQRRAVACGGVRRRTACAGKGSAKARVGTSTNLFTHDAVPRGTTARGQPPRSPAGRHRLAEELHGRDSGWAGAAARRQPAHGPAPGRGRIMYHTECCGRLR
jgi:hypothetical protein